MRYLILSLFMLFAPAAHAQQVVAGMSDEQVGIDTFFDGSELFVYGAIRPDAGNLVSFEEDFDVIITIASPLEPVTVRRKERRFGIWVNVDAVDVDAAPHYYGVATTGPLSDVLDPSEDIRHSISPPQMIRTFSAPDNVADPAAFSAAVQRIREDKGLYQTLEGAVEVRANTLFSTSLELPANLTEGQYELRIFIARDGVVLAKHNSQIAVQKVGAERWLYDLAHQKPVYYGLLSLAIAIFSGWAASAVFRIFRP